MGMVLQHSRTDKDLIVPSRRSDIAHMEREYKLTYCQHGLKEVCETLGR